MNYFCTGLIDGLRFERHLHVTLVQFIYNLQLYRDILTILLLSNFLET